MENKQKIILGIFHLFQEIYGRTYIQKLVFLLNKEVFNETLFNYTNYKFGPYSSEVNAELSVLVREGLIEEKEEISKNSHNLGYKYVLTDEGITSAKEAFMQLESKTQSSIQEYVSKFVDFCPTEILKYVYNKYPEVTINSEFKDK